jgi:hypothetical protein
MPERDLFDISGPFSHTEIFLGEYPCDIPFGGGDMEQVSVSLTTDSPRSKNDIPVLRLHASHQMDFLASEQTPAGHASKLVADWLNRSGPDESTRYVVELFLWQWPGIRQTDEGNWRLVGLTRRSEQIRNAPLINIDGESVSTPDESAVDLEAILDSGNLQVQKQGFCNKGKPCYILDGCLLCPFFLTNVHFIPTLQKRTIELQNKRLEAVAGNNYRLAEACHDMLQNIEKIMAAFATQPSHEGEKTDNE